MSKFVGVTDRYLTKLTSVLNVQNRKEIDHAINAIAEAWQTGRQIVVFGNGGSALTAQHFVTDWAKSISMSRGKPFLARTLGDNIGLITAYTNDVSYAEVFREQLKVVLNPRDVALAISGSGNSENIIRAVEYANEIGAVTIGLCGYRGGRLKPICNHVVWADVDDMQLSEDIHMIFGHIVMQALCGLV